MDLATNWSLDVHEKIYVKIDSHWFDLTAYSNHPGGTAILRRYHLKDATEAFKEVKGHSDAYVDGCLDDYLIRNRMLVAYLNSLASASS